MSVYILTVGALRAALNRIPDDVRVLATWEGITRKITIYRALEGTALLDADGARYRKQFESGEKVIYAVENDDDDDDELCPSCEGKSPPRWEVERNIRDAGDSSGACDTCKNTHYVKRSEPELEPDPRILSLERLQKMRFASVFLGEPGATELVKLLNHIDATSGR